MTDNSGDIVRFIRPHLVGFTGYSASTSPDTLEGKIDVPVGNIIKLNANENPYGCSPRVARALADCPDFHIYPDDGQQRLRGLLAEYASADAGRIVVGHGSNTLIDYLVRMFVGPGDEVINCIPTFDIYRFSTQICGGTLVNVERDENYAVDVKKVISAVNDRTRLIFLASPNNPTGNVIPAADILKIAETGLPVVVDEAYYEFSGETLLPQVDKYRNLIVLRTFSKWAGLAGLRIGYGIFPPAVAGCLMAIKIPHNVSVAAGIAVRESLADIDYLRDIVGRIVDERRRLFGELEKIAWLKPFPSQANFIFCRVLKGSAAGLYRDLQRRGILVRYFDNPLLQNCIRISVGKPAHTEALIKALHKVQD